MIGRGFSLVLAALLGCSPTLDLGSDSTGEESATTVLDSSVGLCEAPSEPESCLACVQASCCPELAFCADQQGCTCFHACVVSGRPPGDCRRSCDASSGMAAILSCLGMHCGGATCSGAPESTGD